MTAIEDARAALRDPLDFPRTRAALQALVAEHERLTAEPTVREDSDFVMPFTDAEWAETTGGFAPPPDDEHEALARRFHEVYERLAPSFGYKTREASAVPWEQVPEANRLLMIAVVGEVLADFRRQGPITDAQVKATAQVLRDNYDQEFSADHLTWEDFAGEARAALEAARDAS